MWARTWLLFLLTGTAHSKGKKGAASNMTAGNSTTTIEQCKEQCSNTTAYLSRVHSNATADASPRCVRIACLRNCTGRPLRFIRAGDSGTVAIQRWASCPATSFAGLESAYSDYMRQQNCDNDARNYTVTFTLDETVQSMHPHESVFFLFGALLLGVATLFWLSRHCPSLPYSSVLLVEGILLVVLDRQSGHQLGALSRSIKAWEVGKLRLVARCTLLPCLRAFDVQTLAVRRCLTSRWWSAHVCSRGRISTHT